MADMQHDCDYLFNVKLIPEKNPNKLALAQLFNHIIIYRIIPLSILTFFLSHFLLSTFSFSHLCLYVLTAQDIGGISIVPADFTGKEHTQHIKIYCMGLLVQGRFVLVFQTYPISSMVVFRWSFKKKYLKQVYSIAYGGIYFINSNCNKSW